MPAEVVPGAGLEPARHFWQGILNPQCLPFHHPGRVLTLFLMHKFCAQSRYLANQAKAELNAILIPPK